jgi:hypothetical protein
MVTLFSIRICSNSNIGVEICESDLSKDLFELEFNLLYASLRSNSILDLSCKMLFANESHCCRIQST